MYDTIRLRSPFISLELYKDIYSTCIKRQGIDLMTGELIYQIVTGDLDGSYDSRISIQCRDYDYDISGSKVNSLPYVILEASVHKIKDGHNVYGGFNDIFDAVLFMINKVEEILCIKLPCWYLWQVERIDISQNYYLGSEENVEKWFYIYQMNDYQRRKVNRYENQAIYISGSTTTIKMYAKGIEFKKHDYKRLKAFLGEKKVNDIYDIAKNILRIEVEIKKRKLKYELEKDIIYVRDLSNEMLENIYNDEIKRFLRSDENMRVVINNAMEVRERLYKNLSNEIAGNVFSAWVMLSTFGYKETKKKMSRSTFYKYVKILKDLAITWYNTDVSIMKQKLDKYDLSYNSDIAINKLIEFKNIVNA